MDSGKAGLVALALLTIGAGLGRASVEPEVVTRTEEKVIVKELPAEVETVYTSYVPKVCLQMARVANKYNNRTIRATDWTTSILDSIALAKIGISTRDPQDLVDAENNLRQVENKLPVDLYDQELTELILECKNQVDMNE